MKERISVDPAIHFGKPCVAGTRIPVLDVLALVREGIAFERIVSEFCPDLEIDDVRACMRFAMEVVSSEDIHLAAS